MAGRDLFANNPSIAPVADPAIAATANQDIENAKKIERGNIADSLLQGLTAGWGDEGLSYGLAAIAKLNNDVPESVSFDDARAGFLNELRGRASEFEERNPKTAMAAEIGGSALIGGLGLAKVGSALTKPSSSILRKAATYSGIGAAEGALYGSGAAEEGEKAQEAKIGAVTGAVVGPLAAYGINKVSDIIGNRKVVKDLLDRGIMDNKTAGYMLAEPKIKLPAIKGKVKLKTDRIAKDALDQGWNKDAIMLAQRSNPDTRREMDRMITIRKEIQNNPILRGKKRTSNVIGEGILRRYEPVNNANKAAGERIDNIADNQLSKIYDEIYPELNREAKKFLEVLQREGIDILDGSGVPINASNPGKRAASLRFDNSNFMRLPESAIIDRVFERLIKNPKPTAKDVHQIKRYIDNNISYGSDTTGAKRSAEKIISDLRSGLDSVLDNRVKAYDNANKVYAETIEPIKEIKRFLGKNSDIEEDAGVEKAGTLTRRIRSMAVTGPEVRAIIEELDEISKKYGYKGKDDLESLMIFEGAMNNFLGETTDNSARNIVRTGTKQGLTDVIGGEGGRLGVINFLKSLADPTINEDNAIDSMEKLLKRKAK